MKKVLSLALVIVLVLGMSTMAFAATAKIDKGSSTRAVLTGVTGPNGIGTIDVDLGDVSVQGDTLTYMVDIDFTGLVAGDFKSGTSLAATSGVISVAERKASKMTLKSIVKKGGAAFDGIDWNDDAGSGHQRIEFNLMDTLKSNNTDGIEFEVQLYIIVDSRHWNTANTTETITFTGTLINDNITIDTDDGDYVYMGSGIIVEADEYIKKIECDLDNGVSVFAKMFNGKKYWAVSDDEASDDQELVMDKYGIDAVYTLKNVGLAAVTDYVLLNDEDSDMYVYDGDLNYLGTGNSKLPWSDTYYLSAKQLEIEDDDEPIEDDDETDVPEISDDLGGDDDYPANVNDNPGTGC